MYAQFSYSTETMSRVNTATSDISSEAWVVFTAALECVVLASVVTVTGSVTRGPAITR